jgi:hypothetical protein
MKARLDHVRWIGGSPGAGKTTITRRLGERHHIPVYHYDQQEADHIARRLADPEAFPYFTHEWALSADQAWLERSPEAIAQAWVNRMSERFRLVVEDIGAFPADAPLLVEGPGLYPHDVWPLLTSPTHAIWLVPSASFCRARRLERERAHGLGQAALTKDTEQARERYIDRDVRLAAHVRRQAEERGLTVIEVDGTRSVDEVAAEVERHLHLPSVVPATVPSTEQQ